MATSKTVSSVSKSNKPNTNQANFTYLSWVVKNDGSIDEDSLFDFPGNTSLQEIVRQINDQWDTMDLTRIRIIKVKNSDIKSIKQTLELV